jgi:propionate CoA-transferase
LKSKVRSVSEALDLIKDGDKLAISAVGVVGYPEYLNVKLEERFLQTGHPAGLTVYAAGGHGMPAVHAHDARFAHAGFLKRHVCTHSKVIPELRDMIENNELEGYILPQGVMNQLYRAIAARQPGILSKIGIGTYIDPRQEGGKMNAVSKEDIVRVMELDGEEWLFYKSFPVTLIRGTYADEKGNVTIDREALKLEMLECAMAAKASGGKVIAQVERVVENFSLKAKDVVVPGQLVDAVVVSEQPELYHKQTGSPVYNPFLSGEARSPAASVAPPAAETLGPDDIMCRRAAFELFPDAVVNLGVGAGGGTGMVAAAEGISEKLNFTLELGVFGGTPVPPPAFGVSVNPESFVSPSAMFDFYHGGNLDLAVLGAAEVDKEGNVNASRYAGHRNGQGGFIDISSAAKKVIFCTTLRTKGLETEIGDGKLQIRQEGKIAKFVDKVAQVTFNGALAAEAGQEVYYITERAVFKREKEGIVLTEIAPGIDLQKDVLDQMEFRPLVSENLKLMDKRIFRPGGMGCFGTDESAGLLEVAM